MDGFAVLFDDVAAASAEAPVTLRVVADLPAGTELDPPLVAGEAARIMTGSPIPTAASAVIPFEDTIGGLADSLGQITVVRAPRPPGLHIRRRGEDAVVGDELLPAGIVIGPLQAGAAAAAGVAEVAVTRLPRVAVISLAKRIEEVFLPGRPDPVLLDPHSPGLQLLQRIRDEAHRFAVGFHRQRRDAAARGSIFDTLEGVGPARRRALLLHFGSAERVLAASQEELEGVPGVPAKTARSIYAQLHKAGRA
jgi:hypothetical protein